MNEPGHIYILINPSIDGMVKIGKTTRDPDLRAKELSQATGVPTPFYVAFSIQVADCDSAEEYVHAVLEHNGFERARNREFFQMSLQKAVELLMIVDKQLQSETSRAESVQSGSAELFLDDSELPTVEQHPGREILDQAIEAFHGRGDAIKDEREALRLFCQAKSLNFPPAYTSLADYHTFWAEEKDFEKAFDVLKEGAKKGHGRCFLKMAEIFLEQGEYENAGKCWKKYFQSQTFVDDDDEKWGCSWIDSMYGTGCARIIQIYTYFRLVTNGKIPFDSEVRRILAQYRDEIVNDLRARIESEESESWATPKDKNGAVGHYLMHLRFVEEHLY